MNGYDIDLFSTLTGLELEESQLPVFERALNRAFSMLENELGWSFNYSSNYKEVGKVKSICSCPKYLNKIKSYCKNLVIYAPAARKKSEDNTFVYRKKFIRRLTKQYEVKIFKEAH